MIIEADVKLIDTELYFLLCDSLNDELFLKHSNM